MSTGAPAATRASTTALCPSPAARMSDVSPHLLTAFTEAPASSSASTVLGWPPSDAHISGVLSPLSPLSAAAPAAKRAFTAEAAPTFAAPARAVRPSALTFSMLAPPATSASTAAVWPPCAACRHRIYRPWSNAGRAQDRARFTGNGGAPSSARSPCRCRPCPRTRRPQAALSLLELSPRALHR
eukprot:7375817-Prymnesium_polylepis.4